MGKIKGLNVESLLEDSGVKAYICLCGIFGNIANNLDKNSLFNIFRAYQKYRRIYGYQPPQKAREMFWENFQIISPIKLPSGYKDYLLSCPPEIDWLSMQFIISRLINRYERIVEALKSYR